MSKKIPSPLTSPINSDSETEFEVAPPPKVPRNKRVKSDSEPEEGELPDSDTSDGEFNDGYASDLMGNEEDRSNLARMTEKERELELFRRADARDELKKRYEIEKRLKESRRQETKRLKLSSSSLPSSSTSSYSSRYDVKHTPSFDAAKERPLERKKSIQQSRGQNTDKKSQAMNKLKALRDEKHEKERLIRLEQEKKKQCERESELLARTVNGNGTKTKLRASDIYSDDSGSSSDEGSRTTVSASFGRNHRNDNRRRTTSSPSSISSDSSDCEDDALPKPEYVTRIDQLSSVRLSRSMLAKLVHLPFFKKVAVGSYVRVMVGNSQKYYIICEISDICESGSAYQLENTRTNKSLVLKHGATTQTYRMEFISNQEFTPVEFMKWQESSKSDRLATGLTVETLRSKIKDIQEAMSYEFKDEDVDKIVKEKEKFKSTPYNFAVKKTQLLKERDTAQSCGDMVKVAELQAQLNELEQKATELDRLRTSSISNISYINNRNRRKNVEEAEKAILAELRANKGQRADDPFTRRHTKPCMILKAKRSTAENETAAADKPTTDSAGSKGAAAAVSSSTSINEGEKNENDGCSNSTTTTTTTTIPATTSKTKKNGEDMYAAHDFEIKIDFDVPTTFTPINYPPSTASSSSITKIPITAAITTTSSKSSTINGRSLNLEDYKRRNGFI